MINNKLVESIAYGIGKSNALAFYVGYKTYIVDTIGTLLEMKRIHRKRKKQEFKNEQIKKIYKLIKQGKATLEDCMEGMYL